MSKYPLLILCAVLAFSSAASSAYATNYYTYVNGGNSGNWNDPNTWTTDPSGVTLVGSAVPASSDLVTILNGYTVTLTGDVVETGLRINIQNGGTLDLATFTLGAPVATLSGAGTLKIKSGYFPTVTTNNFQNSYAAGATVEYYDFTGVLPVSINYPNLVFTNTTGAGNTMTVSNAAAYVLRIYGNLTTRATGAGTLTVTLGNQITNLIRVFLSGNATFGANTVLTTGLFNIVHQLNFSGSMTNNGTVNLSNGTQYTASTNGAATMTFTGATDNTLACNGVTNFYTLTVNKGLNSTNTLSVTSTNTANLNFYSNGQLITLTTGTLRLGANINIPRVWGSGSANYDVGATSVSPMLWVDGATVNTNGAALVVYGKFRITAGSFTSLGGQGAVIREEGQYIIEGGTFTTEKFRPSTTATTHRGTFIMSGGIFNASGTVGSDGRYARFSLPFPEQVFIMSGGVINVSNPESGGTAGDATNGGIHIGCNAANYNVTGGTFNAILSGSAAFFDIASVAPFWNLHISRTGGTPTTVRLNGIGSVGNTVTTAQPLAVLNDFTVNGTNASVFLANNLNVTLGGGFTIGSNATYTPGTNTTIFNGSGAQAFSNSGTITSGLYNMTVAKPAGTLTLSGSVTSFAVSQTLSLTGGVLNDGGKTILAYGSVNNSATHTGTGSITLSGSSTQTITGNGSGVFGNVVLNNASSPGASATADLTIAGILTLAGTGNSIFDIAHYLLSLTSTSATAITTTGNGFSNVKMIRTLGLQSDRGVKKTYSNVSAFTFAFGSGPDYTPATIQLTSVPTTYGTITARPVTSRHQFVVASNANNLTYYWKVVGEGFTGAVSASHTYRYVGSDVAPVGDDVNYVPARYNNTAWTVINNLTQVDETNKIIYFTNVGYITGDYTAGVPASFGTVKIFYSKRNGNYNNTGAGTTPWSNVSHTGPDATTAPGAGDQVFIGDGATNNHVVTITNNNQAAGGLEINAGSTLDVGTSTGHNFGRLENAEISGSGLLRISSATATAEFPAGDFGNFIRSAGGTVEYYTTGATSFTIPKASLAPTNLPLISYRNLILTPGTGRVITMPDQDMRMYNNMTVQGVSATGVVRLNSAAARQLTVNGNIFVTTGNLQFINGTAQTVSTDNNVIIGTGAIFDVAASGTAVTNTLAITRNLQNNGVFDMAKGSYHCNTTFTGPANATITGTGTTTDFNVLTVSKGSSQATLLEVNVSAFSLSGTPVPLALEYGTFRLTSAQTVTIANGADFSIPAATRLSANGGTMQLTGNDGHDMLVAGTLEVLAGAVNVGTTNNDNSIEYAATGQPTITVAGGALNVKSQIRRSFASSQGTLQYGQSGGAVAIGVNSAATTTRGIFEILNQGSNFTMTGGSMAIERALTSTTIAELYLQPSSYTVSGGTIEIGKDASTQTIDINSIIPVYNVTVTGTDNIARLDFNGLTLRGSLSIEATNVFNANSLDVSIAGDFTNANTTSVNGVTAGGYQSGVATQTTTLNGSTANQLMAGVSGNLTNFGNLIIRNTFTGGVVDMQPNTNLRVYGTLSLIQGTLAGNANTIATVSHIYNGSVHTSTGAGRVLLTGPTQQVISGNGSGKFGNLALSNTAGAVFAADQEVTGTMTLTSGILNIASYRLYISNTSLTAIAGATSAKYIATSGRLSDAGLTKAFDGSLDAAAFTFPVGSGTAKYTPVTYTLTTGTTGGNMTVKPVNSKHPSATGSGLSYLSYYWNMSHTITDLTALTHRYTYRAEDENGTLADYRDARFIEGAWTIGVTAGNPNITTRVITFTNIDAAGDYTAGEPTAFVNPTTYTSVMTGNWETDAVWDIDPPGTNLGPPPGSFVIINNLHTVTVNGSGLRPATLEVRGRLHLGNTTGHDLGTVSTSGSGARTIQLQSSTFPTGNFSTFVAAGGGTVDYNGAMNLPATQTTYNNLAFTGTGTKVLPSVDLTLNGNMTISAGTVSNAANRAITLVSTTGDLTNNGIFNAGDGAIEVGRHLLNSGAAAVFTAGNGTAGLRIGGDFTNNTNATFTAGTDSIGVRGNFVNAATFTGASGALRVSGGLTNSGTLTSGAGVVIISGTLSNTGSFTNGTGAVTVRGAFSNSNGGTQYRLNNSTLTISGNFGNTSGATFDAGSGTVSIAGNWNSTGTFTYNTSNVIFAGAGAQAISGSANFYNATRTNGGTLTMSNTFAINNLLTLAGGMISTGANQINLTNTATQPVVGYDVSSYIDGRLAITFPTTAGASRTFPVGQGTVYRPVTIQQTAVGTSGTMRVEMINTPPGGAFPASIERLSEARYFSINRSGGTIGSPTVEIGFNTNGAADESIATPGNVRIVRATSVGGPWTDEGGSGVYSPAYPRGYATSGVTTLAATTYFALGYQNAVLPIQLISFKAVLNAAQVDLTWTTATEHNNALFTIERAGTDLKFDSIGFVPGAGDSQEALHYATVDYTPLRGISYYRLKQTDFDGTAAYSALSKVENNASGMHIFRVYPNPAVSATSVWVRYTNGDDVESNAYLTIADVAGRRVYAGLVDFKDDVDLHTLGRILGPGVYLVTIVTEGFQGTKKLVVR
ncbi:T9SS type A sorting domain-containing protein [Fulvivirgaceae bacterium PWU5]|uniref:T9SS type A sorting domain-containing protein n=1 Tax=Dawidia cretensis TaxID=2782350 RepID=A0AAP2E014_9BACT|nr:T9SS type A sorting domain-containing protein [Dawidia cretensis]MBT1709202.1 T9SS type A sorting domain-containing protein [Dawidia cretensis]